MSRNPAEQPGTAHGGEAPLPSVVVAIATTNRAMIVARTVRYLTELSDLPARIVVSVADPADFDPAPFRDAPVQVDVLLSPRGSCAQRNTVLDSDVPQDIILFLDDDFIVEDGYFSNLSRIFERDLSVVMTTGRVLADGVHGPGFSFDEGLNMLRAAPRAGHVPPARDVYSVYGCNMALRTDVLERDALRFDETLPLYGWLEDLDFSRRMSRNGRVIRDETLRGVHLGTRIGRSRGELLGYSQIANPFYLARKGTMEWRRALQLMSRNMIANFAKSVRPEPTIDRRARLKGNALAMWDLMRGRITPKRILEL